MKNSLGGKLSFMVWTTAAFVALSSIVGGVVHAQGGEIEAVDMVTGGCGHCTWGGPTGWGFTPTVNIDVTHLGIFDESENLFINNPSLSTIQIGLFDSTGSVLLTSIDLTATNSILSGDVVNFAG